MVHVTMICDCMGDLDPLCMYALERVHTQRVGRMRLGKVLLGIVSL